MQNSLYVLWFVTQSHAEECVTVRSKELKCFFEPWGGGGGGGGGRRGAFEVGLGLEVQ